MTAWSDSVNAESLTAALGGKWLGTYGKAPCPAHEDEHPSLSVTDKDGKLLVRCHTGCSQDAVVEALKRLDLWPGEESVWSTELRPPPSSSNGSAGSGKAGAGQRSRIVATYDYADERGELLYQAVRYEPKDFRQRRPDSNGGWVWNLDGVRRVLFRLPELLAAQTTKTVFVPEGEKDVERLRAIGLTATCNAQGAEKWLGEYDEALAGRHVVILPDNDAPGRRHAALVASHALPTALSVRIVALPGLPEKGDVSDWLDAGHGVDELKALVMATRPISEAPETAAGPESEDPYPLQNLAELVLLANETLEPLVDGLIWGNRLHWIFSPPGAGKTIFLTALGMHVAAGRDFCGRKVKQGPVLFIEEDSPLSVLAEYVEMIAEIYDFDLDTLPFWVNKVQGLRLTNADGLERAWQAIMKCPEFPILAFFDASERLVPSEKFSSRELDFLAKMLQRYIGAGGTPGVIDHTKRPQMVKGKIAEPDDPMELLYGARAKQAISDVMLYFSGTFKAGEVNIKYAKFRGETPPNVGVQFDPELGFKIKSDARNARTPAEQQVMKWLNNNTPGTWHQLAEIIAGSKVPERTGERAISNLKKRGWIERDDSPKKSGARYRVNVEIGAVFE